MRDFAAESRARNKAERSRQEKIDKMMCRPGYTWNETVQRCLGPAGGGIDAPKPPPKAESANQAVAMEAQLRQSQGVSKK